MKKKFVTNLFILLILNVFIKLIWIFLDISVQNQVKAEEYGTYISLWSFTWLFCILLDMGITNFNNINISQHNQLLTKHFSNILVLRFILAFVFFIICFTVGYLIGYEARQFKFLFFLVINQILLQFILYFRSNISGLHLFSTNSFISVLDRTLMALLCVLFLSGIITDNQFKIEWFIYIQTTGYLITAIVSFFIVFYHSRFFTLHFNRAFLLFIIKQSMPYAFLILLMGIYMRIDTVLIERLFVGNSSEEAGIYAQSLRIFDAAYQFAMLFPVLLLPMFAKMIKNRQQVNQLLRLSFLLLIVPVFILCTVIFFYHDTIIRVLYNEHIDYSSSIFCILMMSLIPLSVVIIFGTLLTSNSSLRDQNIIAGLCVAVNLVMNIILIPSKGAVGAAFSCLATQSVAAVGQIIVTRRIFRLKTDYSLIFQLLLFIIIIFILGWITKNIITNPYTGMILLVLFSIILSMLTKLLNIRSIYRILKYDEK